MVIGHLRNFLLLQYVWLAMLKPTIFAFNFLTHPLLINTFSHRLCYECSYLKYPLNYNQHQLILSAETNIQ